MARIIDLTDSGDDADILTSTSSSGLLGGQYLGGRPLVERLWEDEAVQYVLRNKKHGVDVEGGGAGDLAADEDYQTLAAVTDLRILFVAGTEDGDRTRSIHHRDIVQASAESAGFLQNALVVETLDGVRYTFPCRGDVEEVARAVDDAAQAWGTVERRLDDAEAAIDEARTRAGEGDYEAAVRALKRVRPELETAADQATTIGSGAVAAVEGRVEALRVRYERARRRVFGERGASNHAAAQTAWAEREYETAAERYEAAVRDYERASQADGEEPSDWTIDTRIAAAVRERAVLRAAPIADAETARLRAESIHDAANAATAYQDALERYQDTLGLAWGEDERQFLIDRSSVREQAAALADDTISAHRTAAEEWVTSGDKLVAGDRDAHANRAYARARDHVDSALELAREVRPGQTAALEDLLETVEKRLEGEGIPEEVPERLLDVEGLGPFVNPDEPDREAGTGMAAAAGPETDGEGKATAAIRHVDEDSAAAAGESAEAAVEAVTEALRETDEETFRRLVAQLWEAEGWSTTVFASSTGAVYDVLAMDSDGDRLLIWTVHAPDSGTLPATTVERAATARDSGQQDAEAAVVTSGRLTTGSRERAADLDVDLVGGEALAERLREADLLETLDL